MDNEKQSWLGSMVTKRATVMTPLLILNTLLGFFATAVYLRSEAYFMFFIWAPILIYTLYRHEKWANKSPWLLAPQRVAIHGMDLFGTSEKGLEAGNVIDLEPIDNPQMNQTEVKGIEK